MNNMKPPPIPRKTRNTKKGKKYWCNKCGKWYIPSSELDIDIRCCPDCGYDHVSCFTEETIKKYLKYVKENNGIYK